MSDWLADVEALLAHAQHSASSADDCDGADDYTAGMIHDALSLVRRARAQAEVRWRDGFGGLHHEHLGRDTPVYIIPRDVGPETAP